MARITPDLIKSLITQQGTLYVPKSITDAIGSCAISSANAIRDEGNRLREEYDRLSQKREPILIDYSGVVTIDAYTVYYLPGNTLVPKLSILYCAYNPAFQSLPEKLRILDVGSGTGGVILGLLDLFQNENLADTSLDIVAVDASAEALERQSLLVQHVGLHGSSYQCCQADLSDPSDYQDKLASRAPYSMVFAANIFAELTEQAIDALLEHITRQISDDGIIINVESQSNYAMRQRARIAKNAQVLGLHIYYPCPPNLPCPKSECWMWREDNFECPDIIIKDEPLETTQIQKAHWMIFCREDHSIHGMLTNKNSKVTWGIKAPKYRPRDQGDVVEQQYEVCTIRGLEEFVHRRKKLSLILSTEPYKRGSFIGYTDDYSELEYWDIV